MTIGRGRRRHCGWQCVHLESHNNRTGAPRFNYTCAGRRAGEKVFCVWNFGLHFFGHFRLVLFVCPGCLRSFGAFVSRPHFHSPTAEKIRKMLTLTFPRERKPDGRPVGRNRVDCRRWSLVNYGMVAFCIFSFDLTSPYIDKLCVHLRPALRVAPETPDRSCCYAFNTERRRRKTLSLSLRGKKNLFLYFQTKSDRYTCRYERLVWLCISYLNFNHKRILSVIGG